MDIEVDGNSPEGRAARELARELVSIRTLEHGISPLFNEAVRRAVEYAVAPLATPEGEPPFEVPKQVQVRLASLIAALCGVAKHALWAAAEDLFVRQGGNIEAPVLEQEGFSEAVAKVLAIVMRALASESGF